MPTDRQVNQEGNAGASATTYRSPIAPETMADWKLEFHIMRPIKKTRTEYDSKFYDGVGHEEETVLLELTGTLIEAVEQAEAYAENLYLEEKTRARILRTWFADNINRSLTAETLSKLVHLVHVRWTIADSSSEKNTLAGFGAVQTDEYHVQEKIDKIAPKIPFQWPAHCGGTQQPESQPRM